tara:strand:- start:1166 stop:1336 length:171 start_codon:yes stop_codon:yes gene_type:complete
MVTTAYRHISVGDSFIDADDNNRSGMLYLKDHKYCATHNEHVQNTIIKEFNHITGG